MTVYSDTIAENLSITPANAFIYRQYDELDAGLKVSQLMDVVRAQKASVSENFTLADALKPIYGIELLERLSIDLGYVVNHKFHLSIAEQASFRANLISAWPVTVSEALQFTAAQLVQRAVTVMEKLQLEDVLTPAIVYHMSIGERILVADTLARFMGAAVIENLTITPAIDPRVYRAAQISENFTFADALTPHFILRVTCDETLEFTADEAVRMIFNAEINEAIDIAGAYLAPNGSVTTWVMNTRSGAVSEYHNYAFNSFARVGNKYLGASENGLYELLGDNDDGSEIVATIRSGFAQWAGTHLGSVKGIYLAVRGTGDFVLRVITSDGKTYNYTVTTQNGRNTKIATGKGLRSRYFAFELVSTGQDFDLDTLEFIPLVADRRV